MAELLPSQVRTCAGALSLSPASVAIAMRNKRADAKVCLPERAVVTQAVVFIRSMSLHGKHFPVFMLFHPIAENANPWRGESTNGSKRVRAAGAEVRGEIGLRKELPESSFVTDCPKVGVALSFPGNLLLELQQPVGLFLYHWAKRSLAG